MSRGAASASVPAFQDFLEANRIRVYRFLVAAVGAGDADDCFQETFIAALRAYPRVTDPERLDRWALKIASRKAIDHHRARARRPMTTDSVPEIASVPQDPGAEDQPVWAAVGALPPRQRVAVVHRHVFDRSYAEIADLMACTEQTARANVSLGVRALREMMR